MLAHGAVLRKNGMSDDEVKAIAENFRNAGLKPEEVAVMNLAHKVSLHAQQVSAEDVQELRDYGLTDEEIFDVIVAAAARSFFSKVLDAVAVEPDEAIIPDHSGLLAALSVGRPARHET
jgi:uncharacterized peroxidase-related enzyme